MADVNAARVATLKAAAEVLRELSATYVAPAESSYDPVEAKPVLVGLALTLENWATVIEAGWFVDQAHRHD